MRKAALALALAIAASVYVLRFLIQEAKRAEAEQRIRSES